VVRRQVSAYLGLGGEMTRHDWLIAVFEVAPPLVGAFVFAGLDSVEAFGGWLLGLAYFFVLRLIWTIVLRRLGVPPPSE
jgi:hypothetical protein